MLGITSGITPSAAYLASTASTRTDGGIAGNGSPASSITSISADRSLPLTTSWLDAALAGLRLDVGHHAVDERLGAGR